MNRKERIIEKISNSLEFNSLDVLNNSHLHKGHMGDDGSFETHYKIIIDSNYLNKISRINAHKEINKALKGEFDTGLHALEIKVVKKVI